MVALKMEDQFAELGNAGPENAGLDYGHTRFCSPSANTVSAMGSGCPVCGAPIQMDMHPYQ